MRRITWRNLAVACTLLLAAGTARAVDVRIATMNVCNLAGGGVAAFSNIVKRVQPDVVALQECSSSQEAMLTALFATLPKPLPHRAFMKNPGTGHTTASGDKVAIFSAWPIANADAVKENYVDPDAVEFMRWPIHAQIVVPGALNPLHVITLHAAAETENRPRRIHRALEAWRVRDYVEKRILGEDENDVEYVVLGDFNDSAPGRWTRPSGAATFQPESFTYAEFHEYATNGAFGSGGNFVLGSDHPWHESNPSHDSFVMDYRTYPTERFGDLRPVDAFQTGSSSNWVTELKSGVFRLDYILFSPEIMASRYGAPVAEVYHSAYDSSDSPGLRKPGELPDPASSTDASDHLLVFSDFHMIDEVGGLTPVAILSEVVHNPTNAYASYVEICNTGNGALDLSGYRLELYADGSSTATVTRALDGVVLDAGEAWWIAGDSASASLAWGIPPDDEWSALGNADGDDAIVLRNAAGAVHDIYGAIGEDGSGKTWEYTGRAAARVLGITEPMDSWVAAEWDIAEASVATPGTHAASEANASLAAVTIRAAYRDSVAPLASEDFRFSATAMPNMAATNLSMSAWFRVDGAGWIQAPMTNASGRDWLTPPLSVARSGGSVLDYYVSLSFGGPGAGSWSPVLSPVYSYTFPAGTNADHLTDVLINEIAAAGTTGEFIELVGGAGVDISGWSLEWYTSKASLLWSAAIPDGSSVSSPGITDEWGNPAGFFVLASSSAPAARDGTAGMMDHSFPRILVLRNAAGAAVDAVALATTNEYLTMTMPPGLSNAVARGAGNYLHCIGRAPATAGHSIQAPNDVRTGCTDPGLHALPDWCSTNATSGRLNTFQTSDTLSIARVDRDGDGVLDDSDNCPSTRNTLQSDIDGDGYGDDCDDDMDGDGIPNGIDNCPAEYNPLQEDFDGDGIGNACDPSYDEAAWEGRTETLFLDFENINKPGFASSNVTAAGRAWTLDQCLVVGNDAQDRKLGTRSMRARREATRDATLTLVGPLTNGLHALSLFYASYDNGKRAPTNFVAEISSDGGTTWKTNFSTSFNATSNLTPFVAAGLDVPPGSAFRLRISGGNTDGRLNIDNLLLVSILPTTAACELAEEITVGYDGTVHTNEFRVTPAGAAWSVAYTSAGGATTATPTEIGIYTAIVTVEAGSGWDAATFTFPASLSITEVSDEALFAQWLQERFGATTNTAGFARDTDADRDGMTTWDEFLADTCPTDAASRLELELRLSNTPALFFTPSTGRWYQLLWKTNLLEGSPFVRDLGRPATTNAIPAETNLPAEWFGFIRALLHEPQE